MSFFLLFLTIDGQYVVKYKNNKFPGSELYRKMCPFVSESCLHQKLCQITGCEKKINLWAWENEKIVDPLHIFGHLFAIFVQKYGQYVVKCQKEPFH